MDGTAVAAKKQSLSMYGQQEPFGWIAVGENRASPNDWLLSFTFTKQGVKHVKWMFADFIVRIAPKEKRYYYARFSLSVFASPNSNDKCSPPSIAVALSALYPTPHEGQGGEDA